MLTECRPELTRHRGYREEVSSAVKTNQPVQTQDLCDTERLFLQAMTDLQFGYFERIRIEGGRIMLDPSIAPVRQVKFGSSAVATGDHALEFQLKQHASDFFAFVRSIERGEIRRLEVRYGLPVLAEVERCAPTTRGR